MIGLFRYTAEVPVRLRSPYTSADFYGALSAGYVSDIAPIGTSVEVLLDWGYTTLDPTRKDIRFMPSTPTGFSEVISHGWKNGHKFSVDFVIEERDAAMANDYAAMNSVNDHLSRGVIEWFPDYIGFPTESVLVAANTIIAPKRKGSLKMWTFSFDFMELPSGQTSKTVPVFV